MNEQQLKDFLVAQGYKIYPNHFGGEIQWIGCKRIQTEKFCLCNDKPPQYVVEPYYSVGGKNKLYYKFYIRAEATPGEWIDFQFYSCLADEIESKLPVFESLLLKAWEAVGE